MTRSKGPGAWTDDEVLAGIEMIVGRSATLYEQLERLVSSEDVDPETVAQLRGDVERATADWYAVHEGASRMWDLAKRSEWPEMLALLRTDDRASLEAFLGTYRSGGNTAHDG